MPASTGGDGGGSYSFPQRYPGPRGSRAANLFGREMRTRFKYGKQAGESEAQAFRRYAHGQAQKRAAARKRRTPGGAVQQGVASVGTDLSGPLAGAVSSATGRVKTPRPKLPPRTRLSPGAKAVRALKRRKIGTPVTGYHQTGLPVADPNLAANLAITKYLNGG